MVDRDHGQMGCTSGEFFSSSLCRTCFKNGYYDEDVSEKNCQKAESFHQTSEDHQYNVMDVSVSAGQREERRGITKEMVNFIGAERQVKYTCGVDD